jgi:dCTP deaminase
VQPSSFDVTAGEEVFVIDAERGLFRPQQGESIYRSLLELPARNRLRRSIVDGYELKRGFTYLIPIQEVVSRDILSKVDSIRSSPKSSTGRLFPKTRLLADYNPSFDEIHNFPNNINLWLLVQPLPINFFVKTGDALNQIRFFKGDAKLSSTEIMRESQRSQLLYDKGENGNEIPIEISPKMIIDGGLQVTLDLEGHKTQGVVGLRARKNPDPIMSLSQRGVYRTEDYFEPIVNRGEPILLERGEHYLFSSGEIVSVPEHLSAELRRYSREGIEGRSHDAGFIDNGFVGDVVFEISPDEETKIQISHKMPLSRLDFYRTSAKPDKTYSHAIGSNYQNQMGPRTSKHFGELDYENAARNHRKLSRIVLVHDAKIIQKYRSVSEGFEPLSEDNVQRLLTEIEKGFFHSRYDCEDDDSILQPIPYVLFFNQNGEVFSYVRSENRTDYGDTRLFGKHSLGVGGHVIRADSPEYIRRCLERELDEEVKIDGENSAPKLLGTLYCRDKPVDRVHFGLIYAVHVNGNVSSNEKALLREEMVPIGKMRCGYYPDAETETWSRILIPHLKHIYSISR